MLTITIAFAAIATTTIVEAQQLVISSGNGSQIQFVGSKPDGQPQACDYSARAVCGL